MGRNYGVHDIENWKFDEPTIPVEWQNHLGDLPVPFSIYVDGDGGHGKTEYIMLLSKMIANFIGKVHLNNVEQGKHKSIQQSHKRNNFTKEVPSGKWMYKSMKDYMEYTEHLAKRNSCKVAIIDSISFFPLNQKQIQALMDRFKTKSFVFVAYEADATKNKPIKHLCDIKVNVRDFIAYTNGSSRFGGNEPFMISKSQHEKALKERRMKKTGITQPNLFDQ